MNCISCGNEIPDASAFCPLCGQVVARDEHVPEHAAAEPAMAAAEEEAPVETSEPRHAAAQEPPVYMPRAEDRPGLSEKPPVQKLPLAGKKDNKALFLTSGILIAIYLLYRIYFIVFTGSSGLYGMNSGNYWYDYVLIAALLILCVFCFALRGKKPLLYMIPLGLMAAAYICMAAARTAFFVYMLNPLLMLVITALLILNATGAIKTSIPALFLSLMQAGAGVYSLYSVFLGRMTLQGIHFSVILSMGAACIIPALLDIALALFAAAVARKKTL